MLNKLYFSGLNDSKRIPTEKNKATWGYKCKPLSSMGDRYRKRSQFMQFKIKTSLIINIPILLSILFGAKRYDVKSC